MSKSAHRPPQIAEFHKLAKYHHQIVITSQVIR